MKQILCSTCLLLLVCNTSNAQESLASNTINAALKNADHFFVPAVGQSTLAAIPDKNDNRDYQLYKRRSRTMRITGLSLLGGGVVLGVTALLMATDNTSNYSNSRDNTIGTLFVLSAVTGIASIPFMILAHANNHKARTILKNQGAYIPGKGAIPVTGLAVSVSIGK